VSTDPAGARVWVVGRGEVCERSPCSFQTEIGRPITVRARSGRAEGESELTPAANTMVQLELRPVRRAPHRGDHEGGGHGGGGTTGDLKIPDIFRN
jgi:hypothetical protein